MCASSVVSLPFLGLFAAGCLEQDFLQFGVAQLPLLAVGPRPVPVLAVVVTERCGKAKSKQEDSKERQQAAGQRDGAETPQGVVRVALPWRCSPHGGDQRGVLVGHLLFGIGDHFTALSLFVACQPHLDKDLRDAANGTSTKREFGWLFTSFRATPMQYVGVGGYVTQPVKYLAKTDKLWIEFTKTISPHFANNLLMSQTIVLELADVVITGSLTSPPATG